MTSYIHFWKKIDDMTFLFYLVLDLISISPSLVGEVCLFVHCAGIKHSNYRPASTQQISFFYQVQPVTGNTIVASYMAY